VKAIREVAGVDDNTKLNDPGWRSVRLLGGSHGFSHGIDRHSKKPIQLSDGSLNQSLENEHFAKAALRHLESADWFKEQELIYDVHQLLGLYFHELATNPHNNHYLPAYYSNVAKVVRVATVLQAEENAVSQETSVE